MSTIYIQYPQNAGGSVTGSMTGVAYSVGTFDGFSPKNANGGVIGSFSLYLQGATATFPGLVSSASQEFSGTKTFLNTLSAAGVVSSGTVQASLLLGTNLQVSSNVTAGDSIVCSNTVQAAIVRATNLGDAPVRSLGSQLSNGSISLTSEVSGQLPLVNMNLAVGPLDGADPSVSAAVLGSNSLYLQSATAINPGIVSSASQTFGGLKTFNAGVYPAGNVYLPAGLVTAPSLTFDGASSSGIYVVSSSNWAMSVNGALGLSFLKSTGGFANLGIGGQVPTNGDAFPVWIARSQNTTTLVRIDNTNAGALAASGLQMVGNGVSTLILGYSAAASSEALAAKTSFNNVTGRGVSLISSSLSGDASVHIGGVKQFVVSSAGAYLQTMQSGPARTLNGIFSTGSISLANETTGSVSLVNQAVGNLPLSQTSGSLSLSQAGFSVLTNPMTTPGDIIVGSGTGVAQRLGIGAVGSVPMVDTTASNSISWQPTAIFKNYLVNSAFDYFEPLGSGSVLNSVVSPTITQYTAADQWFIVNNVAATTSWESTKYVGVLPGSLFGLNVFMSASNAPSNGQLYVGQMLSSPSSAPFYGQRASCALQVKASGNITAVNIAALTNTIESVNGATVIASANVNINSASFTQATLPNFLIGTAHGTGGVVGFRVGLLSVSTGSFNNAANGFKFEQGIFNLGPVVQPFVRQYTEPTAEITACRYFFERLGWGQFGALGEPLGAAFFITTTAAAVTIPLKASKRTVGTVSFSGAGMAFAETSANKFAGNGTVTNRPRGVSNIIMNLTIGSTQTVNDGCYVSCSGAGYLFVDARMG